MAKNKRHEICLVVTFNKPCTKADAVRTAKDCIHGDFYPNSEKDGAPDKMKVVIIKSKPREDR